MRLLQVTGYLPPHSGGVESSVSGRSRELHDMGMDVDVATSEGTAGEGPGTIQCPAKVRVLGNPIMKCLDRVIKEGAYDIVHLHTPPQFPALQTSMACSRADVPYVVTYHCDGEVPWRGLGVTIPVFMRTAGRRILDRAERIIVTTEAYAATSPYLDGRQYDVIPTGVDTTRFGNGADGLGLRQRLGLGGRFVAGFVGRLVEHKGVDDLLRAVARMPPGRAACLVVGDGPRREHLGRLARRERVERAVFTGPVDDRELPDHYAAMDVLVLPSRSREEAFGLTLLEAMASGRPVVASGIPGPSEVALDGFSMTFPPGDVEGLGDCLSRLAGDRGLVERMGRRARTTAEERYDWKGVARRLADLYREVVR